MSASYTSPKEFLSYELGRDIPNEFSILATFRKCGRSCGSNERQPKLAVVHAKQRVDIKIKAVIKEHDFKVKR